MVADTARHCADSPAYHHSVSYIAVHPQIPVLDHLSAVQGDSGTVQRHRQQTEEESGKEGAEGTCRKAGAEAAR